MSGIPSNFMNASVNTVAEIEALVGACVTGEMPEVFWEDSHGHFQFSSEGEARAAVGDPYYQQFLPEVDWSQTVVRQVSVFRPYCSNPATVWLVVEKASEKYGPLSLERRHGRWRASFGKSAKAEARIAAVAICLAALSAAGVAVDVDHDRIDAELSRPSDPADGKDVEFPV
jgi:hypothetical protein